MTTDNITFRSHWVAIRVTERKSPRTQVEFLKWSDLPWDVRTKWDWYFKYRAALLQVKYPRCEVLMEWGNEPAQGKTLEIANTNSLRAKKAKITEWENKIARYRANWRSLFPIEDDPSYQRAVEKLNQKKFELQAFIQSINPKTT